MDGEQLVEDARQREEHAVSAAGGHSRRDDDQVRQGPGRRVRVRPCAQRHGRVAASDGRHQVRARGQHQAELSRSAGPHQGERAQGGHGRSRRSHHRKRTTQSTKERVMCVVLRYVYI